MVRVGRLLSVVGIAGYTLLLIVTLLGGRQNFDRNSIAVFAFDVFVGLAVLASFIAWVLALYHLWYRPIRIKANKLPWSIALLLGVFVTAWVYWFRTPSHYPLTE
jgi:hypothetical protein